MNYHGQSTSEIYQQLNTSKKGLNSAETEKR